MSTRTENPPPRAIPQENATGESAELVLKLPPPAFAAVKRLLAETGDSPGEMFRKAIGLYMMASDAKKRGKAVGAADSPEVLETEFTGF